MDKSQSDEVPQDEDAETGLKWSHIVRDFTERTTFHGLRYITEDTRYVSRRISWVLIVFAIIGVFSYAIISRILHFYERPVYIDLQVGYMDEVPFPAVTVCNQNPYRLSSLQVNGMYEIIRDAYSDDKTQNVTADVESCEDEYMLNPVVCSIPRDVSYSSLFVELTISTCKRLCSQYASDSCSGFLYEMETRSCTLTSYTGEEKQWYTKDEIIRAGDLCHNKMAYFYRRIRCAHTTDIYCSFEDGDDSIRTEKCRFEHDTSLSSTWQRRQGPDSTFGTANGHFLQLFPLDNYTQSTARIQTDFMDTTSKCIMVAGRLESSEDISIKILKETLEYTTVLSTSGGSRNFVDWTWNWLYATLPSGFHRVVVEGHKIVNSRHKLMIDDVAILSCEEIRRNCTRNPKGSFFLGNMYTSENGENCTDAGIFSAWQSWDGWAYSDYQCNVHTQISSDHPRCDCSETEFSCSDGFCISETLICDRVWDCEDGSDESHVVCGYKDSFSCDFMDSYICGYHSLNEQQTLLWKRQYYPSFHDLNGNGYLLELSTDEGNVLPGESALLATPFHRFSVNTLVIISLKSLLHPDDNGIAVRLFGTLGISKNPVLIHGLSKVKRRTYDTHENSLVEFVNTYGGRTQYGLCIPGGSGVKQSILFQAVLTREDSFAIESINVTGHFCNLTQKQKNEVFSQQASMNCSFSGDICGYSIFREHVQISSVFVPFSGLGNIEQMSEWINNNAKGLVPYMGKNYNNILFESPGHVECGPGCYQVLAIVSPEGMHIKVDMVTIEPQSYYIECLQLDDIGGFPEHQLCHNNTSYISKSNVLVIHADAVDLQFLLEYEFITDENDNTETVLAFLYTGQYSQDNYFFQMYSPAVSFTTESCLTFSYLRQSTITVKLLPISGEEIIIFEDRLFTFTQDQFVFMTIPMKEFVSMNDSSVIIFQGEKTQSGFPHYSLILKYVYMYDIPCEEYSLHHQKELQEGGKDITGSCDFDDDDQCAYIDISQSHTKWIRDQVLDKDEQVRTVMRFGSSTPLPYGVSSLLISPLLVIHNDSCMRITVAGSADPRCFFCRQSFVQLWIGDIPQVNSKLYVSTTFTTYTLELPAGEYRMKFQPQIYQAGLFLYIDEVQILTDCFAKTTYDLPISTPLFAHEGNTLTSEGTSISFSEKNISTYVTPTSVPFVSEQETSLVIGTEPTLSGQTLTTDKQHAEEKSSRRTNNLPDGYTMTSYARQGTPRPVKGNLARDDTDLRSGSLSGNDKTDFTSGSLNGNDNIHFTGESLSDTRSTPSQSEKIEDLYLNDEMAKAFLINKLDQIDFSKILSQRIEEFLIRCTWDGKPCNESLISATETDMGTCLSFNAKPQNGGFITTDKSGPLHGLHMILNVEKYEDVESTGTNSGVKIHFYPTDDVPVMQSSGYFVSPGSHVQFNLKYTNSTFLEPEYGTCGRKDLALFPQEYTHSRCSVQCATDDLWENCRCYLPYMSADEPDQCRIFKYLTCVLPRSRRNSGNQCECPDSCKQVVYEAQLSTSEFSDEAVATLLSDRKGDILKKYQKSLSMRERLRDGTFLLLLSQIDDMNKNIKKLHTHLEQDSQVSIISEALQTLISEAQSDLKSQEDYYGRILQNSGNCSECDNQWSNLQDQLRFNINGKRTSTKNLNDIQNWCDLWTNRQALNVVEIHNLAKHFTDEDDPFSLYSVLDIITFLRTHLQQNVIQNMKTNIENTAAGITAFYGKMIQKINKCHCVRETILWNGYADTMSILRQPRFDFDEKTQAYADLSEDIPYILAEFNRDKLSLEIQHHTEKAINQYTLALTTRLDEYLMQYQELESDYLRSVDKMSSKMEEYKQHARLDAAFVKDNIIQVDAYFGELKYTQTSQRVEYGVGDFFGDLGGFLGLLLGASVVTVVEILDLILYHVLSRYSSQKIKRGLTLKKKPRHTNIEADNESICRDKSASNIADKSDGDVTAKSVDITECKSSQEMSCKDNKSGSLDELELSMEEKGSQERTNTTDTAEHESINYALSIPNKNESLEKPVEKIPSEGHVTISIDAVEFELEQNDDIIENEGETITESAVTKATSCNQESTTSVTANDML